MFKSKLIFIFVVLMFTCDVIAQDVYITGGDGAALQAAIDAANVPGSQVTAYLEAGQVFKDIPKLGEVRGNLRIEGNGAVFGDVKDIAGGPMGIVAADGVVMITGATFVNADSGALSCNLIDNFGRLYLERVSFSDVQIQTEGPFLKCDTEGLLVSHGSAELDLINVTIAKTNFWAIEGSVIRSSESASTRISHLTVVDTTFLLKGDSQISILRSDSKGSISVSNSIILADESLGGNLFPCEGPITDNGGNFASPGDCGFSGGVIDRSSLGQIIEKGHDAWVLPLLADSIAISGGNHDYCQKLDGRGFERNAQCDSGAYESSASSHGGELGRGGISGFYYTPESNGNYIQVQRAYDGNVVVIWNTFDASGAQAWINAVGSYQDGVVNAAAYRNSGGMFQPGGGASGATEADWGTLRVTAHNCWQITVEYDSSDPEFGSGSFEAQRLAYVHDLGCSEN